MVMEPPSPQCVGREFVRQYYTLLNQAPLHLHRFYSHNSSFVHGGLDNGKEAEAVYGQQDIHQKIMQLNFRDCHAKIRQVDSHETLANGVVVQVSGELSNNGEPMRRFMQTFVLAPQSPKKYYVHNDIFRYQDEVFNDGEDTLGANTSTEDPIGELKEIAQEAISAPIKQVAEPKVESVSLPTPQHTNGSNSFEADSQAAMEVEEPISEWKEPVLPSQPVATFQQIPTTPAAPVVEQQQPATVWKSPEPEVTDPVETVEEAVEVGEPVVEAEVSTPESNAPRTWSSLVKSGGGGAAAPQQGGKPPLAPQASIGRDNKEGTPFSQTGSQGKPYRGQRGSSQGRSVSGTPGGPQARPERFSKDEDGGRNSDSQQLFVGNLPHNCAEDELVELFTKYGKVVDVRINQKAGRADAARGGRDGKAAGFVPNFGFIVFEQAESVDRALKDKPIMLYGSHRLNVEEKKMRTPRDPGQPFSDRDRQERGNRGSQDNLRGAGHPGGRGGGDRGRGGGRGGGRGRGDFGGPRGGGRGGPPGENRGSYRGGGGGRGS